MYLLLIYSGSEETRKLLGVVAVRLKDQWLRVLCWELGVSSYEETLE